MVGLQLNAKETVQAGPLVIAFWLDLKWFQLAVGFQSITLTSGNSSFCKAVLCEIFKWPCNFSFDKHVNVVPKFQEGNDPNLNGYEKCCAKKS